MRLGSLAGLDHGRDLGEFRRYEWSGLGRREANLRNKIPASRIILLD
jgi:hypothetical protein